MILLYLIPGFFILYQLYWFYLLHVFDFIASGLALLTIKFSKKHNRIMDYNLKLCLPGKTKKEYEKIKYLSIKLGIINGLLALHQRFLLNGDTVLPYVKKPHYRFHENDEKRICLFSHYGIYYHPVTLKNLYGSVSFLFKTIRKKQNSFFENYFFNKNLFNKNKIYPYLHNEFKSCIKNLDKFKNIYLVCDQKGRNTFNKPITFLNQKVDNFHSSPAVLSKELELPIYFVFCKYDFDNVRFSHKIQKLEFLPEDSTYDITQKIATRFTEEILNQPEQYLWAHNRFNI